MKIKIRGETIPVPPGTTKADLARVLLEEGFTVNEISKAVPMAYSQASAIAKKMTLPKPAPITNRPTSRKVVAEAKVWASKRTDEIIARVSPLRGGKPLGECINCGHKLVGQKLGDPKQAMIFHTGMSGEEYLETVQFCHGYPKSLGAPA